VLPPPFWFGEAESNLYRDAYRQLAADRRVVFANHSFASAKEYEKWIGLPPGAVKVVQNGLSPNHMPIGAAAERGSCRSSFGLPGDGPVLGGLMRFAPEKDPGLWIEAAAEIASIRPDILFLLGGYGHGDIAQQLYQEGMRRGLGTRLIMPGAITDVRPFYGALDVFLLTSRSENLGNVLIEAQAAGVPVVGPAVGGIGEAMDDGVTGILVADRTAKSLAAAVLRILTDATWRTRVQTAGPAFVARKFSHQCMVENTIALYRFNALKSVIGRLWRATV